MYFIDQVDLKATSGGRVLHIVEQVAHIVDACSRGGIHFNKINKAPLGNFCATGALATGYRANTGFAVEAFGEDAANGGFAHTASAGKQIGMVQTVIVQGVNQCLQHMFLPCHFGKRAWTPFTG